MLFGPTPPSTHRPSGEHICRRSFDAHGPKTASQIFSPYPHILTSNPKMASEISSPYPDILIPGSKAASQISTSWPNILTSCPKTASQYILTACPKAATQISSLPPDILIPCARTASQISSPPTLKLPSNALKASVRSVSSPEKIKLRPAPANNYQEGSHKIMRRREERNWIT